ncbi:baseplate J/gp47 family protein, partial [Zavarzinella formosa]|uniref:baseplate J/gp47 family protein n=1 Tax=Zavarzinella formosa TaxID=360055 RepID=UPI00187D6F87
MIEFRDDRWTSVTANPAARLADRLGAFIPGWLPADLGPGQALLAIAERFFSLLGERLEKAPSKARLAFLDALGVEPIPPQSARAPVVMELIPGSGHSRAPLRTQLLGQATDSSEALVFETTGVIGLAASRLVEVKAVLPGNLCVDHTQDVLGEKPFVLFSPSQPIPREMYLAHDRLFAVQAGSQIELHVELDQRGESVDSHAVTGPPNVVWEYFDGGGWTPFAPFLTDDKKGAPGDEYSEDGTLALTRSGTVRLLVSGKPAGQTTVRGVKSYWLRARVRPENSGAASAVTPVNLLLRKIDRFQVRSVSKVGGFRQTGVTEQLRKNPGEMNVRIRLVDDSGAPLDTKIYTVSLADPKKALGAPRMTEDDYFAFKVPPTEVVKAQIQWPGPSKPLTQDINLKLPNPDRDYDFEIARAGRLPTLAMGNGVAVDPSMAFFPFGPAPATGAAFLFACPEIFTKPGAKVTVFTEVSMEQIPSAAAKTAGATDPALNTELKVRWEYWNGTVWAPLTDLKGEPEKKLATDGKAGSPGVEQTQSAVLNLCQSGRISFVVPSNMAVKEVAGKEQLWARANLAAGGYLVKNGGVVVIEKIGDSSKNGTYDKMFPPLVQKFRLQYDYRSPEEPVSSCQTHSDFRWTNQTTAAAFGGTPFEAFHPAEDTRPALYLGFTRALPTDLISLFVNVSRDRQEADLSWEYHDGLAWRRLALETDETQGLSQPGLVQFIWPGTPLLPDPDPVTKAEGKIITFLDSRVASRFRQGDQVAVFQDDLSESGTVESTTADSLILASPLENMFSSSATAGRSPLARFGSPRHWVRLVWPQVTAPMPGDPGVIQVGGIYLNAVWVEQTKSVEKELLGSTHGNNGETFDIAGRPVLADETVEALELDGSMAEAGWEVLLHELKASGAPESDLVLERDEKTGKYNRAWVRWHGRSNFAGSGPLDRHYVLDRTRGKLQFGDGQSGRIPAVNPNNIRITYRTGGGRRGNLPSRNIKIALGNIAAETIFNPVGATGGADGEMTSTLDPTSAILARGPQLIRHRHRALQPVDYEQLARAASPGVAAARVVTPAGTRCAVRAGEVQVIVLPHSDENEPEPQPSKQLLADVAQYLKARVPATVAGRPP